MKSLTGVESMSTEEGRSFSASFGWNRSRWYSAKDGDAEYGEGRGSL